MRFSWSVFLLCFVLVGATSLRALDRTDLIAASTPIGDDWYYLDWFGYYLVQGNITDTTGDIIHNEHGRLFIQDYADPVTDDYWWVDDDSMNAVWRLREADYPDMLRTNSIATNVLLTYSVGSSPNREFFNYSTMQTEPPVHTSLPYTPNGPNGPVPVWWKEYGLVDLTQPSAHDAPILVGQLKHVATMAKAYLDERLGLDASDWNAAFTAFSATNPFPLSSGTGDSDYGPANLGQLKFLASAFYQILETHQSSYDVRQRLSEVGFPVGQMRSTAPYLPWTDDSSAEHHYAPANMGQVKMVFSFDLDNGLFWEALSAATPSVVTFSTPVSSAPSVPGSCQPTGADGCYYEDASTWRGYFETCYKNSSPDWGGYYWSNWFGWLIPNSSSPLDFDLDDPGNFYTWEHQWIYAPDRNGLSEGQWFYNYPQEGGIGWFYVNRSHSSCLGKLTWIWSQNLGGWIYYYSSDANGRWFYSTQAGEDGLIEGYFFVPYVAETVADSMLDSWEWYYFGDADVSDDPNDDRDSDGLLDGQELSIRGNTNLRGDANRNGFIDAGDDQGEDGWASGPGTKGALVLANCDDDDGNGVPDNWIGGDWDLDTNSDAADNEINGGGDINDLAPLWIRKFGLSSIPSGVTVTLKLSKPMDDHAFFNLTGHVVAAEDRIRIFLPTLESGNDHLVQVGDDEILGPSTDDEYTFSDNSIFEGEGWIQLGVEGIEMGAHVIVTLEVRYNGNLLGTAPKESTDEVRIRVAPFVLSDHTMPVRQSGNPEETVFVSDTDTSNAEGLYNRLDDNDVYGVDKVFVDDVTTDVWHQDTYEIGYAKAPYGNMSIVLPLPRVRISSAIKRLIHREYLSGGRGVYSKLPELTIDWKNMGGDLESIPGFGAPGKFFHGSSFSAPEMTSFFAAQGINKEIKVDTSWLQVGHVDELTSRLPDGQSVLIADPEVAWALLLWAASIDSDIEMLIGNRDKLNDCNDVSSLGDIVLCNEFRDKNISFDSGFLMEPGQKLAKFRDDLSLDSPETEPVADGNTGSGILAKGGAFVGFINSNERIFRLTFTSSTTYTVEYSDNGSNWTASNSLTGSTGNTGEDSVFPQAKCFIFKHWWSGTPQSGDVFTFSVSTESVTLEMPVLYDEYWDGEYSEGEYLALTNNVVNCLIDGNTVIVADHHGPEGIDYMTGDSEVVNILNTLIEGEPGNIVRDYTEVMFKKYGFNKVIQVDELIYHNLQGSVHCGTNVEREIPDYDWWQTP